MLYGTARSCVLGSNAILKWGMQRKQWTQNWNGQSANQELAGYDSACMFTAGSVLAFCGFTSLKKMFKNLFTWSQKWWAVC